MPGDLLLGGVVVCIGGYLVFSSILDFCLLDAGNNRVLFPVVTNRNFSSIAKCLLRSKSFTIENHCCRIKRGKVGNKSKVVMVIEGSYELN